MLVVHPKNSFNSYFDPNYTINKVNTVSVPPPITTFGKPPKIGEKNSKFLESLKSITQKWSDTYKQKSLADFTPKSEKAPPPADPFTLLPLTSSYSIGTNNLFTNLI